MAQRHANILEVLIGYVMKYRDVNLILGKALQVLGHAEFIEPVRKKQIEQQARLTGSRRNRPRRKHNPISSEHVRSRASSKQNLGNSALQRAWRGCGAIRASATRLASFLLQCTAGLPRV
jgi:hypothetical protein